MMDYPRQLVTRWSNWDCYFGLVGIYVAGHRGNVSVSKGWPHVFSSMRRWVAGVGINSALIVLGFGVVFLVVGEEEFSICYLIYYRMPIGFDGAG